ncbi:MAG TPA: glycoside hydrolase family 78 protein [Candidatus Binatia bacterium]|jgi:alpha-L-rhamnosidase|nr:glycoside hydrolase family 78 protein [Candidatus Binatia bacterium]
MEPTNKSDVGSAKLRKNSQQSGTAPKVILSRLLKFFFLLLSLGAFSSPAAALVVGQLRCEYLKDPLGIDAPHPRLGWVLESDKPGSRGQRQSAYQIVVAGSQKQLDANRPDLWDTGKVNSDRSIHVPYGGRPLVSEQECFWKVRVWDQAGKASAWSQPAHWSMGLLSPSDWQAKWLGQDGDEPKATFTDANWIWFPEGHPEKSAPVATRYFRRAFDLPAGRPIKSARWLVAADNQFTAFVNGRPAGVGASFKSVSDLEVLGRLHAGKNLLAASVKNTGEEPNPAGFLALLQIEFEQGDPLLLPTDETWQTSAEELPGWEKPESEDSTWLPARNLGPAGMEPWGTVAGVEDRRLAARWLRKEFQLNKTVRRATAYLSGLGLSEFYLNGQRIGDQVLSPGLTDYSKRIFYVTHDVTHNLKRGANAIGVVLGNGRFFAPRSNIPTPTRTYGFPRLLFQMRLEYTDGSTATIASDETWKLTTEGPIRANNEYDGEQYDARLELSGWTQPGFEDSKWPCAQSVAAPGGVLAAQMIDPIRVTATLKPIALTEPTPGTYIFDLGQNMVGWCRLRVTGPRGATVSLRHAETLKPDGTLYLDNIRSAKVTDTYTLKGAGQEVYEPRFTYHGFRYVEVNGYPGKPTLTSLEGRVVNDDLESGGEFTCSNPLLNRIYQNIRWGARGNYRSIPTDCPQRDERQGWLGDRSAEAKGEAYLFNTAALYSKWLQDMADAQKESGSVPDVCPPYWPLYNDNVTWPSSTVIIPGELLEQFGDRAIIARHYASGKNWMDYMSCFVTNGIIGRDNYGDWCVPPEDPRLIHSEDPKRKTAVNLLATAYFYHDALLMEQYARQLGFSDDAGHFHELAETLYAGFNRSFLDEDAGRYDNGSQSSCVLPLAFGLVPESQRERIFTHLLRKIQDESHDHIGTGLIGGQWLMRVLSDHGRADLAYTIATQKTYPSWGYMVENGATTLWELWNGNTADPAMNSGNHVMLVGDLVIWLNEYLAGIKPDTAQPGFKHIIMRPEPVGDLTFVRATHRSPYGVIASAWQKDAQGFHWNLTVPVNTTATVYLPSTHNLNLTPNLNPAPNLSDIKETGKPVLRDRSLEFRRVENGRAVFEIGSGSYHFDVMNRG